jgi:hypothetical protein
MLQKIFSDLRFCFNVDPNLLTPFERGPLSVAGIKSFDGFCPFL